MKKASPYPRMDKEVILQAKDLTNPEARFLISNYYTSQKMRKRLDMQIRHLSPDQSGETTPVLLHKTAVGFTVIEDDVKKALGKFAESSLVGRWALNQLGVGPIIVAGFIAHLDITKAPTVGHFWRFAGRDPTCKWEKGEKRPYNAEMKQLTFHLGESFKKNYKKADCFYGKLYAAKKNELIAKNEAGGFKNKAAEFKLIKPTAENKALLKVGKVPPFYLDSVARTYAVKIFLSHLHAVMFWDCYKQPPPKPFAISILGHAHEIKIPDMNMFSGFEQAYYGGKKKAA